jgi:hypothetical protein
MIGVSSTVLFGMTMSLYQSSAQDVVKGKAAHVIVGTSTWKDVEALFGKDFIIEEPTAPKLRGQFWYMLYPMYRDYGVDIRFLIDRKTGVVQERGFGSREPALVRALVTEFQVPYCRADEAWGKPRYRGIVVGESSLAEVRKAFGVGKESRCDFPERKMATLVYRDLPGFKGKLTVGLGCANDIVEYIFLEPAEPWPLAKTLSDMGTGYCYRRFIVTDDPDDPDPESGRLVENPRGNWVQVEYPAEGTVLVPDTDGRIRAISFKVKRD